MAHVEMEKRKIEKMKQNETKKMGRSKGTVDIGKEKECFEVDGDGGLEATLTTNAVLQWRRSVKRKKAPRRFAGMFPLGRDRES